MLIESIIRRPGGSHIDIDGTDYHFEPRADGAHVCDVTDEDAIGRFLSIREGFRPARASSGSSAAPAAMVLKNGAEAVDLSEMGKQALLKFAKDAGFKVNAMASAQDLRESIYAQAKTRPKE